MHWLGGRELAVLFVLGTFAACSGKSVRRGSDSASRDETGGTSGAQATGGVAGGPCEPGETQSCFGPGRCQGAQSCLLDGSGWGTCDCGSGGTGAGGRGGSGAGGTGGGGSPDGGMAGRPDPFDCPTPPLPFGTTCSLEDTCAALDCGSATALHDRNGCLRTQCRSGDQCAAGERCLPAPVALDIRDCWSSGIEECEEQDGECFCSGYSDCSERAVCVPLAEFPKADDCPTEGLTCDALRGALANVDAYLEAEDPFSGDAREALDSCREKLSLYEPTACDFCETWSGAPLVEPETPAAAVAVWSSVCSGRIVGLSRGCGLTVVFVIEGQPRTSGSVSYLVYDQDDRLVGRYDLHSGNGTDCARSTERSGIQIACYDGISSWCDPTLRQLFNLDQQARCSTLDTCKVCGPGTLPQCINVPM